MIVIFGTKSASSAASGPDQQVADEQRMPGKFGDDARRQGVGRGRRRRSGPARTGPCRRHAPGNRRAARRTGAGDIALLLSHQTCGSVLSSRTTNLSLGERPVCWPVSATRAPCDGQPGLAAADRLLAEAAGAEIVVDRCPVVISPAVSIPQAGLRLPISLILLPSLRCRNCSLPASRRFSEQRARRQKQKRSVISNH